MQKLKTQLRLYNCFSTTKMLCALNLFCGDIEDIDGREGNWADEPAEVEHKAESYKSKPCVKATFYDNIIVWCPPCSKMQNTTGTAFPLEVSGIFLQNQSAVIAPNLKRFVCVTLWRWSGLGRSQLQRRGQTLQSNQGFSESRKYKDPRRKAVQK